MFIYLKVKVVRTSSSLNHHQLVFGDFMYCDIFMNNYAKENNRQCVYFHWQLSAVWFVNDMRRKWQRKR
jgi:hypothetical protein